ncbi:nucleotidyltransferase/DNA-binding domain-containing protein, partial [mine drainage metagenome]
DIDVWIKPKPSLSRVKISELSRKLSSILNKQVQIVAINDDRLVAIKKESQNFYYSLVFGSIILFGEGIE